MWAGIRCGVSPWSDSTRQRRTPEEQVPFTPITMSYASAGLSPSSQVARRAEHLCNCSTTDTSVHGGTLISFSTMMTTLPLRHSHWKDSWQFTRFSSCVFHSSVTFPTVANNCSPWSREHVPFQGPHFCLMDLSDLRPGWGAPQKLQSFGNCSALGNSINACCKNPCSMEQGFCSWFIVSNFFCLLLGFSNCTDFATVQKN